MKHHGVSFIALALALLLAELALRFFAPIYTAGIQQAYEYDPTLGVRLRKSVHEFRLTDHLEEIRSNRIGTADFRDDYSGYDDLIFALGDSYTQGTGLAADQSYPIQLDLLLNRDSAGRYQKRIAVINLGLAAFGAEQSLLALKVYARAIGKPAACLYLGSENDFDDDLLFRSGHRHRHVVHGSPTWGRFAPALMRIGNLQLVLRVKLLVASRRHESLRRDGAARSSRQSPANFYLQPGADAAPSPRSTRHRSVAEQQWPAIQSIVDACRARGARVVVAWSAIPGTTGSYEWLKTKADQSSIPFNDWYPHVASIRTAMPALPLANPHSGGHYRGWVNTEIARGFAASLAPPKPPASELQ